MCRHYHGHSPAIWYGKGEQRWQRAIAPFIGKCTLFYLEVFSHLAYCVCRSASTLPMPALLFRSASAIIWLAWTPCQVQNPMLKLNHLVSAGGDGRVWCRNHLHHLHIRAESA